MSDAEPRKAQNYGLGILFLLGGLFCFAAMEATAKYLAATYSVLEITWARYLTNLLCLCVLFVNRPALEVLRTARLRLQLIRAFITALSVPILGDRVDAFRWLSVLVGFAGVLVVARPSSGVLDWPALFVLGAAVCYGFYVNITRLLGPTESPWTTVFYTALVGAVVMSLVVPFFWRAPTAIDWLLLVETGVLGGIGHYFIFKAYEVAQPSALSPFTYSHLLWATLLGLVVFGEFPDHWTIVGAAIIVGSGIYIWHRERRLRALR
jgi:drug/metabolite transporter (DMT)-like permease